MELPPHDTLLLRYGEIGLKSHGVRARMERELARQIEHGLVHRGLEGIVRREQGRLFVEAQELQGAAEVARHTMGITTYSPVVRVGSGFSEVLEAAAAYQRRHWPAGARSFAVRPRRSGNHDYSSQDLAVKAGSAVYVAAKEAGVDVRVDLDTPDWELHIEVRGRDAYLYHERFSGPGGLPLGSQGRMVLLLDSGDAAAAAYLMMRRGAHVHPLYLPQFMGTRFRPDAPSKVEEDEHPAKVLHEKLRDWYPPMFLKAWWLDEDEAARVATAAAGDDGVSVARVMLSAAEAYAQHVKAQAIVTGETVRTPWARRLPETQDMVELPVLRPLMGLRRAIIDDFREQVGLDRLGGARADESERAFTAGGRREGRQGMAADAPVNESKSGKGGGTVWDPW